MIRYIYSADNIKPEQLEGFCVDWQHPLSQKAHLKLLFNSDEIVLAIDDETDKVVGFITAITDKVISAYIPLLEVPTHLECIQGGKRDSHSASFTRLSK